MHIVWAVLIVVGLLLYSAIAVIFGWLLGTFGPEMRVHAAAALQQIRAKDRARPIDRSGTKFQN